MRHDVEMPTKKKPEPKVRTRFKQPKQRLFLKEWRKHRDGMTQARLAERANVTQGMISQLENGKSDYTGELLEKLADALNCKPTDLMTRNPLDPESPWTIWERLKPDQRKVALRMLRAIEDEAA